MKNNKSKIIYTKTDEAPMLATYSLLPIIKSFSKKANIDIEVMDISLAARILAAFPECIDINQHTEDALSNLGEIVKTEDANIIKLPNISASLPQLKAAILELQKKGFFIPSYPKSISNDKDKEIVAKYNQIKGSAVNPVLREGNSDRRAPKAVKNFAKSNPHFMGNWSSNSRTHVATMKEGDFFHNEKSLCIENAKTVRVEFENNNGIKSLLKDNISLLAGEIIDTSFMSKKSLLNFLQIEIKDAKESDILLSLHLKATMMKVSDPIIFSHVVSVYFESLINQHKTLINDLNVDFKSGFGDLINKIETLPEKERNDITNDIKLVMKENADLAMVDSFNGITNLHVPSDVIIDASMPAMIRNSGQMWDASNSTKDTKAVIPDSSYASIYSATIEFCKKNGAFNPSTMGTVPNVGLMAQKAEEYGSHDKTFEISSSGIVRVIDQEDNVLTEHAVEQGDIWRMCQTKDAPIKDWVKLAVRRAQVTKWPTIFWLDKNRPHDFEVIKKVNRYLNDFELNNLDIKILDPYNACVYTLERIALGEDTISVTGNVLRDYLTDLFPILELGTSAKMLSIVPLMNGGGLFETGAGGSAPKHVQQFVEEGHLRWDSLGEFMAIVVSLEHLAENNNNSKANILAFTLDNAIEKLLKNNKSPKRKVGEIDNRESHFYLALYWSEELSLQNQDKELRDSFKSLHNDFKENEYEICSELASVQGNAEDIDGYYYPNEKNIIKSMRPSKILNAIINRF
ncbi:MAG: NADP-dependent isocitrate dehydrogenase [Flavobacteriales bacterium]|nr:NADP-dependent isocitrate dehydrogenase [Flavobacteriales bacterium]MDG2085718.1 NADP-dependent isocitrate dehydrogenase [Flavobacteriales bacterium]